MPIVTKIKCENKSLSRKYKGVDFDVFVVKFSNYNMIMMSTYSGFVVPGGQKEKYIISKVKVFMFLYA